MKQSLTCGSNIVTPNELLQERKIELFNIAWKVGLHTVPFNNLLIFLKKVSFMFYKVTLSRQRK